MDAWIARLTHADDAGYYRTEPAEAEQSPFPWQSTIGRDGPSWVTSIGPVHAEDRSASAPTCSYFDPHNRQRAQTSIQEHRWQGFRRGWEWVNDRGAPREACRSANGEGRQGRAGWTTRERQRLTR